MLKKRRQQSSIFAGQLALDDSELNLTDLDSELDRYNRSRAAISDLLPKTEKNAANNLQTQNAEAELRKVGELNLNSGNIHSAMGLAGEKLEELLAEQAKSKQTAAVQPKLNKQAPLATNIAQRADSLLEAKLDLTAEIKNKPRQSATLKIANQYFQISADADLDYMRTIAAEADLMINTIQKQMPKQDKISTLLLCLLNALDEKTELNFKLNEQDNLIQQQLLINKDLNNKLAVSHKETTAYRRKIAKLAEVFSDILERFQKHKDDQAISSENFKALILQIIEGDRAEKDVLANKEQINLFEVMQ